MLLKCSHCGGWHTVRRADGNVGESEHVLAMLYWLCRGAAVLRRATWFDAAIPDPEPAGLRAS